MIQLRRLSVIGSTVFALRFRIIGDRAAQHLLFLRRHEVTDEQAITAWDQAIRAKMEMGLNRMQATSRVVRDKPDLHRAFLIAMNRNHPRGVAHFHDEPKMRAMSETLDDVVKAFDELVAAKVGTGLSRQAAVGFVAKNHRRLHELYVVAMNRDRPDAVAHLL